MKDNIALIQRVYDAFNKKNYGAVLETFDPKMVWIAADSSPLADRSPYRGLDAVREGVFDRIAAGFEQLTVVSNEILDAGDKVVALGYYHGQLKGKKSPFQAQVAHVWTIHHGRIVKFQQYMDTHRMSEVIASPE
jgi:ketosteroid isomerase-like protein